MKRITMTAVAVIAVTLGACGAEAVPNAYEEPAVVEPIDGTELSRLVLTASAIERLDVQTTPVTAVGERSMVPISAVIIDADGRRWVYTNPEPQVYVRAELGSVWDEGAESYFETGPEPGMRVVTVGVPELYGTEFGIGK